MGDWYQIIVDGDAGEEEAVALGSQIREWLVSEGIVESMATDCVLSSDRGHPPGPHYGKAVDEECDDFQRLLTNGLDVIARRTVFYPWPAEAHLVCSECGERFEPGDEWHAAIGEWYKHRGPGLLSCIRCSNVRAITEWQHDPAWVFGHLGFKFWNRPPLKAPFVEEASERLGRTTLLFEGKL